MLEVKGLNAGYGRVQVLWDVSLNVAKGEIVSVLGPNGAGKSTLLRTIVGLLRPMNVGTISYHDHRIGGMAPEEILRLGLALITEEKHLFPDMTVLENLEMGSYIRKDRAQRAKTLTAVYTRFPRLAERQSQMARSMSGGEKQMLAIGRALMSAPDMLLIDEPSVGLTPLMTTKTLESIREIRDQGVTILMVEQSVNRTLEMSDRAYVLENGRIVMEGKGNDLLHDSHVRKAYLAV